MPRFVLLRHECPAGFEKPSHWDLMLEQEGMLRTWELRELPTAWARKLGVKQPATLDKVSAVALADHRLDYLDYEGPLSAGRGSVQRCDFGQYQLRVQSTSLMILDLHGSALDGVAELHHANDRWTLLVVVADL